MYAPAIVAAAVLNGLLTGAVYALIALGLTLVYGVLHIINFAHGALLTGGDVRGVRVRMLASGSTRISRIPRPYAAVLRARLRAATLRHRPGEPRRATRNILLVTLGLAIVIENALLGDFRSDTRTIDVPYGFQMLEFGPLLLSMPRVIALRGGAPGRWPALARPRAHRHRQGYPRGREGEARRRLVGIDVEHVYAVTFGLGSRLPCRRRLPACCRPSTSTRGSATPSCSSPSRSWCSAAWARSAARSSAGCSSASWKACPGSILGDSLGQIGIFLIFILVLLCPPDRALRGEGVKRRVDRLPIAVARSADLLALLPLFVTSQHRARTSSSCALIIALAAQGWNILGGFGGQFSFGHAAFFGTGAYATAMLQMRFGVNAWVGFAARRSPRARAPAWIIGALTFRSGLRGSYFALVTLAFAEVLRILANASGVTGGAARRCYQARRRAPPISSSRSRAVFFWVALALVAAALVADARHRTLALRRASRRDPRERGGGAGARRRYLADEARGDHALGRRRPPRPGCLYAQYFLFSTRRSPTAPGSPSRRCSRRSSAAPAPLFGPLVGALVAARARRGHEARRRAACPASTWSLFGVLLVARRALPARRHHRPGARSAAGRRAPSSRRRAERCSSRAGVTQALRRPARRQRCLARAWKAGPSPALIGPNGAGKTTLFAIIAGFDRADRRQRPLRRRATSPAAAAPASRGSASRAPSRSCSPSPA